MREFVNWLISSELFRDDSKQINNSFFDFRKIKTIKSYVGTS
jgi:hypothetical protein